MENILPLARQLARARWFPPLVIVLVLAILGATIALGTQRLRDSIRRQLIERDGEILDGVALLEQVGADSVSSFTSQVDDPAAQLALILRLSRLKQDVIAVRLFDAQGRFVVSMPATVRETELSGAVQAQMEHLQPLTRFRPRAALRDVFLQEPTAPSVSSPGLPLVSVLLPLHAEGQSKLLASAELIQDGQALAGQLAALDRQLFRQALLAFLVAGGLAAVALSWAFRRLQALNRQLHDHAASLHRANQELALAAKTSALGAVTAHVVHGLTSPMNGLQHYMATRADHDEEGREALRGTLRIQALLGDIVRVLGDDLDDARYELPLGELMQVLEGKIQPVAQHAGVKFTAQCCATAMVGNREANLVLLILENLLQNAVQATPSGGTVRLAFSEEPDHAACTVTDEGPGLPEAVRQSLFVPVRSTKPGGNGIGLAISQHLARHLGTEIELVRTGRTGTVFALNLPGRLVVDGRAKTLTPSARFVCSN